MFRQERKPAENNNDTNNLLWTGESVFCECAHHIEDHEAKYFLYDLLVTGKLILRCKKCETCSSFMSYRDSSTEES